MNLSNDKSIRLLTNKHISKVFKMFPLVFANISILNIPVTEKTIMKTQNDYIFQIEPTWNKL